MAAELCFLSGSSKQLMLQCCRILETINPKRLKMINEEMQKTMEFIGEMGSHD